jgi:Helix-turn-helix
MDGVRKYSDEPSDRAEQSSICRSRPHEPVAVEMDHVIRRVHYPHLSLPRPGLGFNPLPEGDSTAERLMNHRKARGVTQKEFARQIGVDPSTVARWDRGKRVPKG